MSSRGLLICLASIAACGADDSGPGGGGGGGRTACDYRNAAVLIHYCVEAPGSGGAQNGCVAGGGVELDSCPAGAVGTCTYTLAGVGDYVGFFYAVSVTTQIVQSVCPGGVYTPGPP